MSDNAVILEKIESLRKEQEQNYIHLNERIEDIVKLLRQEMLAKDTIYKQLMQRLQEDQQELKDMVCSDKKEVHEKIQTIEKRLDHTEKILDERAGKIKALEDATGTSRFRISQLIQVGLVLITIGTLTVMILK